jgi:hypothetical protein
MYSEDDLLDAGWLQIHISHLSNLFLKNAAFLRYFFRKSIQKSENSSPSLDCPQDPIAARPSNPATQPQCCRAEFSNLPAYLDKYHIDSSNQNHQSAPDVPMYIGTY